MADIVSASVQPASITGPQRYRWAGTGPAGEAFTVPPEEPANAPSAAAGSIGAANPVLLHQLAVEGEEAHDREAHRHGKEVLDLLAELHRAMLRNRLDAGLCDRLAGLVSCPPRAASPALAALGAGIVLRARIELARHAAPSRPRD